MATKIKADGLEVTGALVVTARVDADGTPFTEIRPLRAKDTGVSGKHPKVNGGRTSMFRGGIDAYGTFKVLLPIPPKQESSRQGSLTDLTSNLEGFLGNRSGTDRWPL